MKTSSPWSFFVLAAKNVGNIKSIVLLRKLIEKNKRMCCYLCSVLSLHNFMQSLVWHSST